MHHSLVKGIGELSLIHTTGEPRCVTPVDYRILHPTSDGKTKHDYFREMLPRAGTDHGLQHWYPGEACPILEYRP